MIFPTMLLALMLYTTCSETERGYRVSRSTKLLPFGEERFSSIASLRDKTVFLFCFVSEAKNSVLGLIQRGPPRLL